MVLAPAAMFVTHSKQIFAPGPQDAGLVESILGGEVEDLAKLTTGAQEGDVTAAEFAAACVRRCSAQVRAKALASDRRIFFPSSQPLWHGLRAPIVPTALDLSATGAPQPQMHRRGRQRVDPSDHRPQILSRPALLEGREEQPRKPFPPAKQLQALRNPIRAPRHGTLTSVSGSDRFLQSRPVEPANRCPAHEGSALRLHAPGRIRASVPGTSRTARQRP
jgi:hypothetical protein